MKLLRITSNGLELRAVKKINLFAPWNLHDTFNYIWNWKSKFVFVFDITLWLLHNLNLKTYGY